MSMTFAQAQTALASGSYTTVASIVGLINQVSGAVVGATTQTTYLLNSGLMPDGEPSYKVLDAVQNAGGGVGVTKSEVGKLVDSLEAQGGSVLLTELRKAIKLELFGDATFIPTTQAHFDAPTPG